MYLNDNGGGGNGPGDGGIAAAVNGIVNHVAIVVPNALHPPAALVREAEDDEDREPAPPEPDADLLDPALNALANGDDEAMAAVVNDFGYLNFDSVLLAFPGGARPQTASV